MFTPAISPAFEHLETRSMMSAAADSAPSARAFAPDLEADGSSAFQIPVLFNDADGLDRDAIAASGAMIKVDGPHRFRTVARLSGMGGLQGDTELIAYFEITPPGGAWTADDVGTYKVTLLSDALKDTAGNVTPRAKIGSFHITSSQASPGPGIDPMVGMYHATWTVASPNGLQEFDLKVTAIRNGRVEGLFTPKNDGTEGTSLAYTLHGLFKPGGKISLVGESNGKNVSVVGRLLGKKIKGNAIFAGTDDDTTTSGPFIANHA